ncbi:CHD5-like domain containing protein [Amanita muscaria]
MSLLLTIFLLTFITQLISWIGQSVLQDRVYKLYSWVTRSDLAKRQHEMKKELLVKKAELLKLSPKDQFAKYFKLERNIKQELEKLEKLNSQIVTNKTAFSVKFNSFIWIFTTGAQLVVGWWYRRAAVFYLPPGWLGPLTWWLSFPFAPKGSVSVGVWQMACRRVLLVCERLVRDLAGPYWQQSSGGDETVTVDESVIGTSSDEKAKSS